MKVSTYRRSGHYLAHSAKDVTDGFTGRVHYYSVPHTLVRQDIEARITQTTVGILHGGRRVARHPRCDRRGTHITLTEHMPKSHRAQREWSRGRLLNWAQRIGPHTKTLVHNQLTHKPHPEMGYRASLGLDTKVSNYETEVLNAKVTERNLYERVP